MQTGRAKRAIPPSPEGKEAESSDKGHSIQHLRPNFQPNLLSLSLICPNLQHIYHFNHVSRLAEGAQQGKAADFASKFTNSACNHPPLARFLLLSMVELLTLRADCSLSTLKPASSSCFLSGKLGEYSDANTGLRSPCPNIHPKNVWMNIRIHFGDGFSGSSEEGCFSGSFAFLPFGFGFFCSSPNPCFSCSSSLRRLFSASMIWILSRRRVSSSAAASRCLEVTSASCCAYDHLSAVVTNFIKGSMSTRPLFWGSSNGCVSHV